MLVCCFGSDSEAFCSLSSEQKDYLIAHVRHVCMGWGCAIFSLQESGGEKEEESVRELQRYVLHRLFPESHKFSPAKAQVLHMDALVIPAGWDSPQNLAAANAAAVSGGAKLEEEFSKTIPAPVDSKSASKRVNAAPGADATVTAYDDEAFLERIFKMQSTYESNISSQLRSAVSELGSGSSSPAKEVVSKKSSKSSAGADEGVEGDSSGKSRSGDSRVGDCGDSARNIAGNDGAERRRIDRASRGDGLATRRTRRSKTSASRGAVSVTAADAKENPEVIKDFFQSLLQPKKGAGGSGSGAAAAKKKPPRRSARNAKKKT